MAFETLEEMNKQTTAPVSLRVFEAMCQHKPLQFKYNGTTFEIPLGEDVIHIFESLVELVAVNVADNNKSVDSAYKRVALDYAKAYLVAHSKEHTWPLNQPLESKDTVVFTPINLPNGKRIVTCKKVE